MRYTAYHGSPGAAFDRWDLAKSGSTSGYDHAAGLACLTSAVDVAQHYAEGDGFIGRFSMSLSNPLEIHDAARPMGIAACLRQARDDGYDGVILRDCHHTTMSPGQPSDLFFVFDPSTLHCVEVLQPGPAASQALAAPSHPPKPRPPADRSARTSRHRTDR